MTLSRANSWLSNTDTQFFLVLIRCIISVTLPGDGLQCHQCSSYDSTPEKPDCVDPYTFGDDNLDQCDDGDTHCVKMKTVATMVDTESGGLLGELSHISGIVAP